MSDQFILQIIWREKDALRFLVESVGQSWRLAMHAVIAGDLPIESALQFGERIFGNESVCTLWKLGQIKLGSISTYVFCLDTETIEDFSGATEIPNMIWIDEHQFFKKIPADLTPLLEKIKLFGPSK